MSAVEVDFSQGSRPTCTRCHGTGVMPSRNSDPWRRRLWMNVRISPSGCWEYLRVNSYGYGTISVEGRPRGAHRMAWQVVHGPIPPGLFVCHRCDNKACIKPGHLYLGTPQQNSTDAVEHGLFPDKRGETNPGAKLTNEKVRLIRKLYAAGMSPTLMGKQLGVSDSTILNVASGRRWSHVV